MSDDPILKKLRIRIDEIDANLLELMSARASIAEEVASIKTDQLEDDFYRPEREAQVLRKIIDKNPGPLPKAGVACIFREIMSACLALEQQLKVAYLGPEGTFTHTAALKYFGHAADFTDMGSIDQVFREVASDTNCHYGIVPIENSIEGMVNHTLDMLIDSNLMICGEIELPIHHHLLSTEDSLQDIKQVFSHQQALAQCRNWLTGHLPHAELIAVDSSAAGVHLVLDKKNAAAIASESASEFYNVPILVRSIETQMNNTTRFLALGNRPVAPSEYDKTSLLFTVVANKVGALQEMLACFSDNGVSLTRIESRPARMGMDTWQYIFFVDIEGHIQQANVAAAVDKLGACAAMIKLLGSYPCAVL